MDINCNVAFVISDYDLKFEEINKNIKVNPTKIIHKGQEITANKLAPYDIWSYEIKKSKDTSITDSIYTLLDQIAPYSSYIKKISTQYREVVINCYIRSDMGQLGFEISREVIEKLNKIGIGLNFHILSFGFAE
jgi:hypothetical protein